MLLSEPGRTQFDLNFGFAGFHVRIHPLFWLVSVLLGAGSGVTGLELLIWISIVFVSILVHELGHALAYRYYGQNARIVLYMLGGLAIPESAGYGGVYGRKSDNGLERIVISAAGPVAGFMLAFFVVALVYMAGGRVELREGFSWTEDFPVFWQLVVSQALNHDNVPFLINNLLLVNIFWGLINLLPVFPLDGGQISRELCILRDPYTGVVRSIYISLGASLVMVVLAIFAQEWYMGLLFGSLGYSSYMMLQQFHGGGFGGGYRGGRPW